MNRRYEIKEKLSAGAMGVVYRAWDRLHGANVAIKSIQMANIRRESEFDKLTLKRHLAEEFQVMASMSHPNIINVLDFGFDDKGDSYFVMDMLDSPVNVVQAAAHASAEIKLSMFIQILQAMSYLHRRGLVHRDLKPDNILVTQQYEVKVIDFGLAIEAGNKSIVVGTPLYIAPEVLLKKPPTATSDLFAVGVIAYEMFAQKHPFEEEGKIWAKATFENEADLSMIPERFDISLPNAISLREVLKKLLAKSAKDRYPTAEAAIIDISPLAGEALPAETVVMRESFLRTARFIGRKEPLSLLEEATMSLSMGQGSAWLLGGESGVGKSRLCDEVKTQALVQGILVLRGQAHEDDAFIMWRSPIEQLVLRSEISLAEASFLQDYIPRLSMTLGMDIAPLGEMSNSAYEDNFVRLLLDLLRRQNEPILLILEDLQWANLSMMDAVIALSKEQPLMILGNYQLEAQIKLDGCQQIILQPFGSEEVAEFSHSMLGEMGKSPEVLALLKDEGNAYLLSELVRALAEESGGLQAVGASEISLATEQETILRRRLKSVPQWAYKGLETAALMGRELDLNILDKILSPNLNFIPPSQLPMQMFTTTFMRREGLTLHDWLRLCANAAILELHDFRWRFCHDKLRRQILADMPAYIRQSREGDIVKAQKE